MTLTHDPARPLASAATGRYRIFFGGHECGDELWRIERSAEGWVITGEQDLISPHPFPSRQQYRATVARDWRVTGLEVIWSVGERMLRAIHAADGPVWRARIEYSGHSREQHGDFPDICEVDYGTHLFTTFILARRDFAVGGEHEFPVLRIGPPMMAVTPERMLMRCVEKGTFQAPFGPVPAGRYVLSLPQSQEPGYSFWADPQGIVLESYEGLDQSRPWMRLVEFEGRA